jgi:2-polyprenyl-6-methoxyphenol hydroxylase-like FAD-dependent oxidoreductase
VGPGTPNPARRRDPCDDPQSRPACQALEDAVVFADALHRCSASPEAGLRDYETRRRDRANFVISQSRRLGSMLQLTNPVAMWLRETLGRTAWAQRQSRNLFERLLCEADLPELA